VSADLITASPAGEMTLIGFYKQMANELDADSRLVLNHLMRGLAERGWLPSVSDLISGLDDRGECVHAARSAITDLTHRRLLELSDDGARITGIMGAISVPRTAHRGHLESSVDVHTFGGVDLLSLNTILVQSVEANTLCGQCEAAIAFRMEDEVIVAISPNGAAGFQASWDGVAPLAEVSQSSPLFCSDTCLSTWTDAHPDVDGLPMSGDLLLHIGAMMAAESGNARFAMFGIQG
jgi:hypothetical protein